MTNPNKPLSHDPEAIALAAYIAAQTAEKHGADPGEHLGEAWLGLHDAASRYDENHNPKAKFTTYAQRRIRGQILDFYRRQTGGRNPQSQAIARDVSSLHQLVDDGNGNPSFAYCLHPANPDGKPEFDPEFWKVACRGMSKQVRIVVLLYFVEGLTMTKAGKHVGLTESRVSQMVTQWKPRILENLKRAGLVPRQLLQGTEDE